MERKFRYRATTLIDRLGCDVGERKRAKGQAPGPIVSFVLPDGTYVPWNDELHRVIEAFEQNVRTEELDRQQGNDRPQFREAAE